jgi:hypothetical protein
MKSIGYERPALGDLTGVTFLEDGIIKLRLFSGQPEQFATENAWRAAKVWNSS